MSKKKNQEANASSLASSANTRDAQTGETAILRAIDKLKEELLAKIEEKAESQNAMISASVDQLRRELQQATEAAKADNLTLGKQVASLEGATSDHSDSITRLEKDMSVMKKQIDNLKAQNDDLEARARRCNLRITGIKEGREEGKRPVEFMAQLLKVALGMEEAPVLDRAHRSLRRRQEDGLPPRAWIIRCHYFQEREKILGKARALKQVSTSEGDKIRVFPDYTRAVMEQRAAFSEVRGMLRGCDGVQSGLWYPAELRITVNGTRTCFKDPEAAKAFVTANIVK